VDKIRVFYNHPEFVLANAERVAEGLGKLPAELRTRAHIAFTAHSIRTSMAEQCDYERQLTETCRLVADALDEEAVADHWKLVYQSRSGRPSDPWLGPDILAHLAELGERGAEAVLVHPIGFLSDHMEVLYDLDEEAQARSRELGIVMVRSATVGKHPRFVRMLLELIQERIRGSNDRRAMGRFGPSPDVCPSDCCRAPSRPPARG
jgi:ferrochelatase